MKLKAFEAYGIEAEYMIVNNQNYNVQNEVEFCLTKLNGGTLTDEVELEKTAISNELVTHVIELKCNGPQKNLEKIEDDFHKTVGVLNNLLEEKKAVLLPTAIHPLMDPYKEMKLWPHGQKEIYKKYNEIFDCRGHGWANLQSVHINLPFTDDEEFGRLHAAIRLVLPLIPYLAASSPMADGVLNQYPDQRLKFYENNQKKIPMITGKVIPERVFTLKDYQGLLEKLYQDIAPYDPEGILQHQWLNSRGAIVKFDVNAIEIRLMDIQESPLQDFSIISFLVEVMRGLFNQEIQNYEQQKKVTEDDLFAFYLTCNSYQEVTVPNFYQEVFNIKAEKLNDFIGQLLNKVSHRMPLRYQEGVDFILEHGNLAKRLKKKMLDGKWNDALFAELVEALRANRRFS